MEPGKDRVVKNNKKKEMPRGTLGNVDMSEK